MHALFSFLTLIFLLIKIVFLHFFYIFVKMVYETKCFLHDNILCFVQIANLKYFLFLNMNKSGNQIFAIKFYNFE